MFIRESGRRGAASDELSRRAITLAATSGPVAEMFHVAVRALSVLDGKLGRRPRGKARVSAFRRMSGGRTVPAACPLREDLNISRCAANRRRILASCGPDERQSSDFSPAEGAPPSVSAPRP